MNVGLVFKIGLGGAIAAVAGLVAWNVLDVEEMHFSVHNGLGAAECELQLDGERWNVSLKPDETIERLLLSGFPDHVTWTCKTAAGHISGWESTCGHGVGGVTLAPPLPDDRRSYC